MSDSEYLIEKHGSRIGGIVNDLASVLRNGDPLTTEGDAYGFEIVTDQVKDGELYISYIENKSAPKRTVANVLIGLSDLFDLRLTPLGGSQEKYYESLGFVKKGKDMVLKKDTSDDIRNPYTKPDLRERLKRKIMAGSKGGNPGQWSARKAQLLAAEYERAGGGYTGARSKAQRSLSRWTKQDWRTKSGKPSLETGERYLPAKAIEKLTASEYAATTRAKRRATGQYSRQPKRIAEKTRRYRNPLLYPPDQVRAYEKVAHSRLGFPDQTQLGLDLKLQKDRHWDTNEFKKWFKDSVVTDSKGNPMLVYHGTCKAGFTKFDPTKTREMGFHFGNWNQAEDFVGSRCQKSDIPGIGPGVYPVYLSIQRPLETPDYFSSIPSLFSAWIEKTNYKYKWFSSENDPYYKKLKYLENEGNAVFQKPINNVKRHKLLNIFNKKIWNHLKAIIMRKGYDGIRYINESEGHAGFSDNIAWIAFSPAQVKSATENRGTYNRRDPYLDNPSMIRSKLSRIIEPGDRILCYDRAQGEDLYRLWDMVHTANPLTKEALVEVEGLLDDDGVLVIESGEEPPGLRDHFRKVHKYGGMLLVQGPMNPEEARINTEKLRRELK